MTDPNLPHHWQVIDTRSMRVVVDNLTHDQALTYCQEVEPKPELTGFRFNMQPVRSVSGYER